MNYFLELFLSIFVFLYSEFKKLRLHYNYFFKFFLKEINILEFLKSGFKINEYSFKNKYFSNFLKINKSYIVKKNKLKIKKDKIIVESLINHPIYTLGQCIIANTISKNKDYDVIGLIRRGDFFGTEIMKSFGINKIKIIDDSNIVSRLIYFYRSFFILSKMNDIKKILNFRIKGIDAGKATYEHYLRFVGEPPTKVDWKIIYFFANSLYYIDKSEKLLKDIKPKYCIQSERQFLPHRILFQQALKLKSKVIARNGVDEVNIKLYKNIKERNDSRNKIPYKFFNEMEKKYKKIILKKSTKLFFSNNKNDNDAQIMGGIGKEVHQKLEKKIYKDFKSIEVFNSFFNFKNSNPVVLILSHQMTDGNFSNSWNLFINSDLWLRRTLKIIKKIKNVNFIIKSHPSEKFYNSKVTTDKIFAECISDKDTHIQLFPKNYNVNSLINYISLSITSHGSAGYEYPAKSIPTIICGDTFYSGLGFCIEPKSIKDYKKVLEKIPKIKKLNKFQTNKAKIFWYIYLVIVRVKMPLIYFSNIKMDYDKKLFWKNTVLNFVSLNSNQKKFEKYLMHQIQNNNSNLINYETLSSNIKK